MKKKLYYIETALNGTIICKKQMKWNDSHDYDLNDIDIYEDGEFGLTVKLDGEILNYGEKYCGDFDMFEQFLKTGIDPDPDKSEVMVTKKNVYLETWLTETVGWFEDRYVGVMIDN